MNEAKYRDNFQEPYASDHEFVAASWWEEVWAKWCTYNEHHPKAEYALKRFEKAVERRMNAVDAVDNRKKSIH